VPIVIDATPGGANANSFCTLAEANTYHDGHNYATAWLSASMDQRNRALATATRLLDELVEWKGDVSSETQALGWPRTYSQDLNGNEIAGNVVPQKLKDAEAEFARQLIEANRMQDSKTETEGIEEMKVGEIELKFRYPHAKVLPDAVFYMIRHWAKSIRLRASNTVPLARV
jgi:hypothetical protein